MKQLILGENGVLVVGELKGNHQESPANTGKRLSQSRLVLVMECSWCGVKFLGTSRALFCGNKCKQKNKRWIKWLSTASGEDKERKIRLLNAAIKKNKASYANYRKLEHLQRCLTSTS